jgi:hypothetical protein
VYLSIIFGDELFIFPQIIPIELKLTFANKMSFWIHETNLFGDFVVDRFVFGETVETQVLRQLC